MQLVHWGSGVRAGEKCVGIWKSPGAILRGFYVWRQRSASPGEQGIDLPTHLDFLKGRKNARIVKNCGAMSLDIRYGCWNLSSVEFTTLKSGVRQVSSIGLTRLSSVVFATRKVGVSSSVEYWLDKVTHLLEGGRFETRPFPSSESLRRCASRSKNRDKSPRTFYRS